MKILAQNRLDDFAAKHADFAPAAGKWLASVKAARWRTPHDIKAMFRSADFLHNNRVIFNIKGNHYRIVVQVRYSPAGAVLIEWVGTHAEYSRRKLN